MLKPPTIQSVNYAAREAEPRADFELPNLREELAADCSNDSVDEDIFALCYDD